MAKAVFVLFIIVVTTALLSVIQCSNERLAAPPKELRKQLAGPPEEFKSMAFPPPSAAALKADSALIPFTLTQSSHGSDYSWSMQYPVDTPDAVTANLLTPFKDHLTVYLRAPGTTEFVKIEKSMFEGPLSTGKSYFSSSFGIDGNVVPVYSYTFYNPPVGFWTVYINSSTIPNEKEVHGYILMDNISPYKLESQLTNYKLEVGQEVGISVHMVHDPSSELLSEIESDLPAGLMQEVIVKADIYVFLPDGNEITVKMHDDGLGLDKRSNDGIYTGSIKVTQTGNYVFNPMISGNLPDGNHFLRSTAHLVAISPASMSLTGSATSMYDKKAKTIIFEVGVETSSTSADEDTVRAYAEVWGSSPSDKSTLIPIAWIEAMVDAESSTDSAAAKVLKMQLNEAWISKSGAIPPFVLQNVVIQNRETNAVLSEEKQISVLPSTSSSASHVSLFKLARTGPIPNMPISEEMKYGPRPAQYAVNSNSTHLKSTAGGKLILVHGYCSGDVWDHTHFTDALKFEDYQQSRSHDQFALQIRKFAEETHKLSSFSIVGHSQGGMAGLHLKSYYWTGLDVATAGRVLQSVGTPYKGCSLAGSLADVGRWFGIGCSSNADLATNGAQLWLAKIPKDAQDKVYFYNTQYDDSWFLAPACVTASGMVMHTPNDGTCEIKFSQPDKGGNNMGNKKSWCHTGGMNYPQQTKDTARNSEMNRLAAR